MYPVLGIDYGRSKIGIAFAAGPLAEPFSTVDSSRIFSVLPRIVSEYSVKIIVVGFPDGPFGPTVIDFISKLKLCFPGTPPAILTQDETLSSHDAIEALLHTSSGRRKTLEHSVAAAIILQTWLDCQPAASVK